jgi:hypothetical protein
MGFAVLDRQFGVTQAKPDAQFRAKSNKGRVSGPGISRSKKESISA